MKIVVGLYQQAIQRFLLSKTQILGKNKHVTH